MVAVDKWNQAVTVCRRRSKWRIMVRYCFGFGVWGLGFGVWIWGLGFGVWGLGFGFGVWGLGSGVSGFRGSGFGVCRHAIALRSEVVGVLHVVHVDVAPVEHLDAVEVREEPIP